VDGGHQQGFPGRSRALFLFRVKALQVSSVMYEAIVGGVEEGRWQLGAAAYLVEGA
jgi:hypothetical protein